MKKILFSIIFLLSFISANEIDIDKLIIQAKKENKNLMFFYHMPGCPLCEKMLKQNFKDDYVLKSIKKNFILVDIDITSNDNVRFKDFYGNKKVFSKSMNVFAVPATQFFDTYANEIKIVDEEDIDIKKDTFQPLIGPRDIRDYKKYLDYIISKEYQKIQFDIYSSQWDFDHE